MGNFCKDPSCYAHGKYCRVPGHMSETFKHIPFIKKESDTRKEQLKVYKKVAKKYLTIHPKCEVKGCNKVSECIHHKSGRIAENLIDDSKLLAVCLDHHRQIEDNPEWAKSEGYSLSRLNEEYVNQN